MQPYCYLDVANHLGKGGVNLTEKDQIKKLLDSLSQEWSLQCMLIKRYMLMADSTVADLINTLKVFDMDMHRGE
jgi:hypothetical protein